MRDLQDIKDAMEDMLYHAMEWTRDNEKQIYEQASEGVHHDDVDQIEMNISDILEDKAKEMVGN